MKGINIMFLVVCLLFIATCISVSLPSDYGFRGIYGGLNLLSRLSPFILVILIFTLLDLTGILSPKEELKNE